MTCLWSVAESEGDSDEVFEVRPEDVRVHDGTAMTSSVTTVRPNGMIKVRLTSSFNHQILVVGPYLKIFYINSLFEYEYLIAN